MTRTDKQIADIDGQLATISQLLRAGNTAEADKLSSALKLRIRSELIELKAKTALIEQRLPLVNAFAPPGGEQMSLGGINSSAQRQKLTKSQKRERRQQILSAALEVAGSADEFMSEDVTQVLVKNGVNMGVPENRYNTAVGAVLRSHPDDFERVIAGVYKRKKRGDADGEDDRDPAQEHDGVSE